MCVCIIKVVRESVSMVLILYLAFGHGYIVDASRC